MQKKILNKKAVNDNTLDELSAQQTLSIFESVPGLYLILKPDAPTFTIVAVSDAYAQATMTKREGILGKGLFEEFPDNPDDPNATGVKNLTASLFKVLKYKKPHKMAIQKYDVRKPQTEGGAFELRYWSPLNSPVLNNKSNVAYIVHSVVDVTDFVQSEKRQKAAEKKATELQLLYSELLQAQKKLQESEGRYQLVVENAMDLISLIDIQETILYASPSWKRITGYDPNEAVGKNAFTFIHPDDHSMTQAGLKKALHGEHASVTEYRLKHKNGHWKIMEGSGVAVAGKNGKPLFVVTTSRDITEKKRAEEKLKDSENRFRLLADTIPNLAWMANPDGYIYWYNSRWYEYTGTTATEMKGWGWQSVHDPVELPQVLEKWKYSIHSGKPFEMVFALKGTDGIFRPFLTRAVPVKDSSGKVTQWFGTNTDITGQKQAEESHKWLAAIVTSSNDAIISKNLNGIITSWNPAAEKIFGYSANEAIGKPIFLIIPPELRDEEEKILGQLKKGIPLEHYQTVRVGKSGKRIDVSLTISPIINSTGKIIGASKIARDITEKKKTGEALKASDKRFRSMLENSYDAIVLTTADGKTIYGSSSTQNVIGYTPEEYMQLNGSDLIHPEDLAEEGKFFQEILQKPGVTFPPHQTRFKHKDGRYRWLEYTATNLIRDLSVGAIVFNFRDITERKQVEERQKFLEQASSILSASIDYETTLKNLSKLIIPFLADYCRIVVVDEKKQIKEIAVNHIDPKQHHLVKELYDAYKDQRQNTAGVGRLLETGKAELMSRITPEVLRNSSPKVLQLIQELQLQSYMGAPMKRGNKIIGAITFSSSRNDRIYSQSDLSLAEELAQRAALAIENSQLYTETQKAVSLRDDFISVASHELKTPITSLKMYTQVLQKHSAKREKNDYLKYLDKIDGQANKLAQLINDLLNVSKLQHGKLEFEMESFDLNDLVKDTAEAVQEAVLKHTIFIEGKVQKKVYGDRYRIYQVLTNLLTNAIKYSPKADKVIVQLAPDTDKAVISVKDFGIGIHKEHQKKIFSQFYRVNAPDEKTYPGLGMGLFIANEIVKRHGGNMMVRSEKGKGSTFSFSLPYTFTEKSASQRKERIRTPSLNKKNSDSIFK